MTHSEIISALQQFWTAVGPSSVPCVFPGTSINVSSATTWIEFWVSQLIEQPQRPASPQQQLLAIDIHVFSKSQNKRDINVLSDSIVAALRSAIVSVSSSQQPGTLRLKEAILRDLTRPENVGSAVALQHWLISIPAEAIATL